MPPSYLLLGLVRWLEVVQLEEYVLRTGPRKGGGF
jgi:hypothetical protein